MTRALITDPDLPAKARAGRLGRDHAAASAATGCIAHYHAGYADRVRGQSRARAASSHARTAARGAAEAARRRRRRPRGPRRGRRAPAAPATRSSCSSALPGSAARSRSPGRPPAVQTSPPRSSTTRRGSSRTAASRSGSARRATRTPCSRSRPPPPDPRVAGVVNAVEGMDGRHPRPPGGQPAVKAGPFAVGVDDCDVELTDQADGEQQVTQAQAARRELHDLEPEGLKAFEENPIARRADHDPELALGKVAHKVVDLLRAAAGGGRGQQLKDCNAAAHGSQGLPRRWLPCENRLIRHFLVPKGDSNPHELPHTPLKRARLPVPPLRRRPYDAAPGNALSSARGLPRRPAPARGGPRVYCSRSRGLKASRSPSRTG